MNRARSLRQFAKGSRLRSALMGFVVFCPFVSAVQATPVVSFSGEIDAEAGAATNPFLQTGNDTQSATGTLSLNTAAKFEEEQGSAILSGRYHITGYEHLYSKSDGYSVDLSSQQRLSERVSLTGSVGYDNSIIGNDDIRSLQSGQPNNPPPVVTPSPDDIGLIGRRQRRSLFQGSVGASFQPNERDQFNVNANASRTRYKKSLLAQDSDYFGGGLGYSRQISQYTQLGLRGSVSRIKYLSGGNGNTTVFSPQVTFGTRFSEAWRASGSIGASISRFTFPGSSRTSTALSGDLSVCRTSTRASLCFGGDRSTAPSGFGGSRTATSGFVTWSFRINELSTVDASVRYSRSAQLFGIGTSTVEYLTNRASFTRRFNERLSGYVSAGYGDLYQNQAGSRKANISTQIGLRFLFGERR
jgi:hypothetical protein